MLLAPQIQSEVLMSRSSGLVIAVVLTAMFCTAAASFAQLGAAPRTPRDNVRGSLVGRTMSFEATAYCDDGTTKSGVDTRRGIVAADPDFLPVGSVVHVASLGPRYDGIYTVMDTGAKVQGRQIDLFMRSCNEAIVFGRQPLTLTVLRLGWNPARSVAAR
jgi:3D (Asp-Asp-Asp) domain-containing protein